MRKLIIVLVAILFANQITNAQLMKGILFENQKENYQFDTSLGSIKVGYLFEKKNRSAVLIESKDGKMYSLEIYEASNQSWNKVFEQDSITSSNPIPYFDDFNFDGSTDLAIQTEMSLGTSILTVKLWLKLKGSNTFQFIPDFEEIGTPTLDNANKIVFGFSACCAFTEIDLKEYQWDKEGLVLCKQTEIGQHNKKIYAVQKQYKCDNPKVPTKESVLKLSAKDIHKIKKKYNHALY